MQQPYRSALIGFLFAAPFFLMNLVIVMQIEPVYSFVGSFPAIRESTLTPTILLLLFPVGAFIALRPLVANERSGTRMMYALNCIVAGLLMATFVFLFSGIAKDFYKCDILHIPNCD